MPVQKSPQHRDDRWHTLRHWSPAVSLSLIINLGLLKLFVFLIAVGAPAASEQNRLAVRLVQNTSQEQAAPPPRIPPPVKKPPEPKKEPVKKPPPEKTQPAVIPPPPKQVVHNAKKPEPKLQPAEPVKHTDTPVTQPLEDQAPAQPAEDNEQIVDSLALHQPLTPQASNVTDAVPLFRLTRMPKILDYDLDKLKRFYPEEERDFGKEATVEAMILVDENGDVVDVKIIKSAGAKFDAAAKKALLSKALIIQPGYVGDKPVASRVPVPITFNLTE